MFVSQKLHSPTTTPTTLKFLLIPAQPNPYDRRMMRGLADGLAAHGHETSNLLSPVPPHTIAELCKEIGAHVVVQVNQLRPRSVDLPTGTRHVAWFQDIFPSHQKGLGRALPGDIVYFLGDPHALGLERELPCLVDTLLTGVDESLFSRQEPNDFACDYSLCGFIPPPSRARMAIRYQIYFATPLLARISGLMSAGYANDFILFCARVQAPEPVLAAVRSTVEANYPPLSGELDITTLSKSLRRTLNGLRWRYGLSPWRIRHLVDYYAREYPRLIDRLALLHAITDISDSVHLYGPGWETHDEFRHLHRGVLHSSTELARVYRTSRINLANNTHGLGLHSRNLECMAVGGFILTHTSPNDDKPGGLRTSFEPGVHYGAFAPDTLVEEAQRWLRNEKERLAAGKRARQIVREKHLWRHRAAQILADLER